MVISVKDNINTIHNKLNPSSPLTRGGSGGAGEDGGGGGGLGAEPDVRLCRSMAMASLRPTLRRPAPGPPEDGRATEQE